MRPAANIFMTPAEQLSGELLRRDSAWSPIRLDAWLGMWCAVISPLSILAAMTTMLFANYSDGIPAVTLFWLSWGILVVWGVGLVLIAIARSICHRRYPDSESDVITADEFIENSAFRDYFFYAYIVGLFAFYGVSRLLEWRYS
jgi:hypothetical protein